MTGSTTARSAGIGLVAFVVAVGFLLGRVQGSTAEVARSVFSTAGDGRLAAWLVLDELGFAPRAWRRAPGGLPPGGKLLWLPAAPEEPPVYLRRIWAEMDRPGEEVEGGGGTPERPPMTRRLRDPQHYLRFVEEGGTLIVGLDGKRRAFLVGELGLAEIEGLASHHDDEGGPTQTAVLRSGEGFEVDWGGARWLEPPGVGSRFEVRIADSVGRPLAVSLPVGRGSVLLLPDDDLFSNASIGLADNGLLLARLLEDLRPGEGILFDEYALGGWVPETPIALALSPRILPFSLHLFALSLLLLWGLAWVREFPRDPEPLGRLAAISRATAHGDMLASARRWNLLGELLRRGVLGRLSRRLHGGRAPAGGGERDDEEEREAVERILSALAHRAEGEAEIARWRRTLSPAAVRDGEALERLGHELLRVERLARTGKNDHNGGGTTWASRT